MVNAARHDESLLQHMLGGSSSGFLSRTYDVVKVKRGKYIYKTNTYEAFCADIICGGVRRIAKSHTGCYSFYVRKFLRNVKSKTIMGMSPHREERISMSEQLTHRLIGFRVKAAREAAGWTQERLAQLLQLNDRQSISDLENGKRRLQPNELAQLAEQFGRDVEFFLDPFAVVGEGQFNWRASPELPEDSLDGFELSAGKWIGLLRWMRDNEGIKSPLKFSLRLSFKNSYEEAISRAELFVEKLSLGSVPAERLIEVIEEKLDIPVLFVDAIENPDGASISGATCHLQDLAVILINRNEVESRRYFDLAHELFHVLTWDTMRPDHRESNSYVSRGRAKRIEELANNFAAGLLMPTRSLGQVIDKRRLEDVAYLVEIALQFRVSPAALAYRLLNVGWINEETKDALLQEHQPETRASTPKRFSENFVQMLHRAIERGDLSARKSAKVIGMSLPQLSDLFIEHSLPRAFEL